jgi:Ca-activated chloride channel homolog
MSLGKPKKALVLFLLSVPLLVGQLLAPKGMAQTQDQGPSGPKPNVDETVIAPKKAQPPAAVQPENKPEKINPNEVYSISTSTNLVNLDVLVEDRDGNPITSLGRKNFKLYDDGVPQTITNFATSEAPLTICLMIEFANRWWPFLYLALGDSYQFLNFMQPKDWVSVVDFDLKPHILTDFTQDRLEVRSALDTLRIPGFSEVNLYDALAFVVDRMKDIHGRKALIVICTGIDTFSKLNYDQALKIAKASDTSIYPVSILEFITVRSPRGDTIDSLQARNALTTIAKYSGGQAYFPRFEGELPGIYQQIAGQLRTQYSLGFMPSDPAREGRFHKIKVDLVDDDGGPLRITNEKGKQVKYRIVSRDGYYAPKS